MGRRLVAILAADVAGYSRLMERDEAGTLEALKSRRRNILAPILTEHHGRIVKLMGDGVLVEFGSAVIAVQCAVDLQRRMDEANAGLAEDRRILLRIGINLGDVIVEGGDLYGEGVNIAARLQAMAVPGGICLSQTMVNHVSNKVEVQFEDLGERKLKNLDRPVRVYRVVGMASALEGPLAIPGPPAAESPTGPSIALLPFVNLSGDTEQNYFSDGITEDIIAGLSRFRQLFVIARNSSFQYRDRTVDVRQVARELGVRFVVEGSVRKAGTHLRVTVQLVEAATGKHLWAEKFDRDLPDIFAVQDEIAHSIVASIAGRIEEADRRRALRKRAADLTAYDLLLRASIVWRKVRSSRYLRRGLCSSAAWSWTRSMPRRMSYSPRPTSARRCPIGARRRKRRRSGCLNSLRMPPSSMIRAAGLICASHGVTGASKATMKWRKPRSRRRSL